MNDILFEKIKDVVQEIGGWTAAILTLYLLIMKKLLELMYLSII
jgi:hypothetical protein